MSPRRPLLRLEEKLAAEDRLLAALPVPRRWGLILVAAVVAVAGHVAILALPGWTLGGIAASEAAARPLPAAWRALPEPSVAAKGGGTSSSPSRPRPGVPAGEADDSVTEPVPEPPPAPALEPMPLDALSLIGDATPPPEPEEPAPAAPEPARPARLIEGSRVEPVMPVAAKTLRARGTVTLALTVGMDGSVESAEVLSCSRPGVGFEKAAVDAALRWRYEPATREGRPVPSGVTVRVEFRW